MKKISLIDAKRSITMFPIDQDLEDSYDQLITNMVDTMIDSVQGIDTIEGLKSYIKSNSSSIESIVTLLGISKEKVKRVISSIRLSKGYTFETEWDYGALRRGMLEDDNLMKEICELFINGYNNEQYKNIVPKFILDDFRIDTNTMARLQNRDHLIKLIKSTITTEYNSKCGTAYATRLYDEICYIAEKEGLICELYDNIPGTNIQNVRAIQYNDKYIVIMNNFCLTTSSGQTAYYNTKIQPLWGEAVNHPNIILVNILDGAGWIGRTADFNKIYYACHYFLTLNTISNLSQIINEFLINQ